MTKYDVYDSYDCIVRGNFPSFKSAIKFKMANNRMDWKIVKREYKQSTEKQKRTVSYIEQKLDIKFDGNIEDFYEVSDFIGDYLDEAKSLYRDACESYYSNFYY